MITRRVLQRVAKPVVLIAEELSPATLDALGPDFEVRNCNGADRSELLAALSKGVDAVLIRSATKMDAEAISAAKGLKVIARAGVGLDNVEIPAATAAGVRVNLPNHEGVAKDMQSVPARPGLCLLYSLRAERRYLKSMQFYQQLLL